MAGLSASVVVLISILAAAAVVAMAAAMWKVYSRQGASGDLEGADAMIVGPSNEQQHYMRDVRMRNQLQAWGVAPAFEGSYAPPRSQIARTGSRGGETNASYG